MKKSLIYLFFALFTFTYLNAQYTPNFSVANKGLLAPSTLGVECNGALNGSNPALCSTYDVSGVNWTLTGTTTDPFYIAYSITAADRSYAVSTGSVFRTLRPLGDVCVTSPVLSIAGLGTVNVNLSVLRSGTGTYASTDDDVEFKYILNGSTTVTSGSLIGGPGTTATWSPSFSGTTVQVLACMACNGFMETYDLTNFTIDKGVLLPIELTGFWAFTTKENTVRLEWQTASEKDNAYFEVERSQDGRHFEVIAQIPGQGNSTAEQSYQYVDQFPLEQTSYYRLKQTDFDEGFDYSSIVTINRKPTQPYFQIAPNPAVDELSIQLMDADSRPERIAITDLRGVVVRDWLPEGDDITQLTINVSSLSAGTYLVQVYEAGTVETQRFTKLD